MYAAMALAWLAYSEPWKKSPQPSHRQIANFILFSQEVDEKLLSFSQLHFDAAWPAILVFDPEDEGGTIGLNKHNTPEHPAVSAWKTCLDISYPELIYIAIWKFS